MLETFRMLILALAIVAPGQITCNAPIAQATVCAVHFTDPDFVEVVTPRNLARLRALVEIKRWERSQ